MKQIEVTAQIDIAAEPTDVAGVMFDPHREPEWVQAVKTVEVLDPGIRPGARVRRTGTFMGRDFTWTTAVAGFNFPHLLELKLEDGPIVGTLTYLIGRSGQGSMARIRTVGDPGKFGALPESLIVEPIRAALTADLARLKALIETPAVPAGA
jgi:hypothetical protein